jgi:hypothetical protein
MATRGRVAVGEQTATPAGKSGQDSKGVYIVDQFGNKTYSGQKGPAKGAGEALDRAWTFAVNDPAGWIYRKGLEPFGYGGKGGKQSDAYNKAAPTLAALGQETGNAITEASDRSRKNLSGAVGAALDEYGRNRPTQWKSLLAEGRPVSAVAGASQKAAAQSRPTARVDLYSNYRPPTQVSDRYTQEKNTPYTSRLSTAMPAFRPGVSESEKRQSARAQGPDPLQPLINATRNFEGYTNAPTETQGIIKMLGNAKAAQRGDSMLESMRAGKGDTGELLALLAAGGGDSGEMMKRLKSGDTELGRLSAGFDPNKTVALGDMYKKLSGEGPTYEEQFYNSSLEGDNPAYNYIREQTMRDINRQANARGGFASGHAMSQQKDALTALGAQEYAQRAQLSQAAGAARRAQLGQQLEGAGALDQLVQGAYGLKGQWAGTSDKTLADLGMSRDTLRGNVAQGRESTMSGLAQSGDQLERDLRRQKLEAAAQQDQLTYQQQTYLAGLGKSTSELNLQELRDLDQLAGQVDTAKDRSLNTWRSALTAEDTNKSAWDKRMDDLGRIASDETDRNWNTFSTLAEGSDRSFYDEDKSARDWAVADDQSRADIDRIVNERTAGASGEDKAYAEETLKVKLSAAVKDAEAEITAAMSSIGAVTEGKKAEIEAQLMAAGLKQAEAQAFINNLIKGYATYKSGGALGGGQEAPAQQPAVSGGGGQAPSGGGGYGGGYFSGGWT